MPRAGFADVSPADRLSPSTVAVYPLGDSRVYSSSTSTVTRHREDDELLPESCSWVPAARYLQHPVLYWSSVPVDVSLGFQLVDVFELGQHSTELSRWNAESVHVASEASDRGAVYRRARNGPAYDYQILSA